MRHGFALASRRRRGPRTAPEQHWQAAPSDAPRYPNYQPSTAPDPAPPAADTPAGPMNAGQYQDPRRPDQPVGPPQYPAIERRLLDAGGRPVYGPQPPDNRMAYPPQGQRIEGPPGQGQPAAGPPMQGPPLRNAPPQPPFVLSELEARHLENLLTDWEKRNKEIHVLESKFYRWKYDHTFDNVNQPPPPPEEGILKFSAPDKGLMKIEAKDPAQSEQWLCDGKSIYQFDYPRKLVTEYVMPPELQGRGIGDGPLPFVFGVEAQKLKQRYFMRIITPPNVQNEVWLEAYPRYQQQAAEFSKVQVILQIAGETRSLLPYAIQIFSPNGKDRTVYQLQTPSINPRDSWLPLPGGHWWVVSIPFGWKKKIDLPPQPVQAGLSPAMLRR